MTEQLDSASGLQPAVPGREMEWGRRFVALTLAWLGFETVSGLAIYLLPFSVSNQWTVVVHTGLGLAFLVPAFVYQWQHIGVYWSRPRGPVKWMGYLATAATLVAVVSGIVLTVQAVWGTRISYTWDRVHLISTFALVAFVLPHVLVIHLRDRAAAFKPGFAIVREIQNRTLLRTAAGFLLMLAPVGILWGLYPGERLHDEFPRTTRSSTARSGPSRRAWPPPARAGPSTHASSPARPPAVPRAATSRSRRSGA